MSYLLVRVFASVLVALLAVPVVANDPDRDADPIWLAIYNPPSSTDPRFELRVVGGTDMAIIESIAECLESASDDPLKVVPSSELSLNFSSDSYVVIRLDESKASLVPGSRFPLAITRALAKQVRCLGIKEVKMYSPDEVLRRVSSPDPFIRSFVTTAEFSSKNGGPNKLTPK